MELEGGITVLCSALRHDQPFLVCIGAVADNETEYWTNDPEEAATVFLLQVRRVRKRRW